MARLATHVWVGAYRMRLQAAGIFCHLVQRGDETAGAVAVKVAFMNGQASLFTRHYGAEGRLQWEAELDRAPEAEVDALISRRRRNDPDLWVVEVEDPRGRHMLDEDGLAEA